MLMGRVRHEISSPDVLATGRPGRRAFPRAVLAWAVLAMAVDIGLARFTYGVTLPAIRRDLGLDYTIAGVLGSVHLLGYLAGTLGAPAVARRFGQAALARGGHLLFALGAGMSALAPGIAVLGAGRLLCGIGAAAGITAVIVLSLESVEARFRFAASATIWAGIGVAVVASGFAAPAMLASGPGWRLASAVAAGLALLLAAMFPPSGTAHAAAPVRVAGAGATEPFRAVDVFRPGWVFLVGAYTLFGSAYIAYATFTGARLAALGTPPAFVTAVWVAFGFSCIAGSALAIAALGHPLSRRLALVGALAASAAGALVSTGQGAAAAVAGAALVGLGMTSSPSIITARLRQRSTAATYAQVFSYATAGLGIGQLAGPLVAGPLADRFGSVAVPAFAAAAYAFAAVMALLDDRAADSRGMLPGSPGPT